VSDMLFLRSNYSHLDGQYEGRRSVPRIRYNVTQPGFIVQPN
jgi:hypothetical protein